MFVEAWKVEMEVEQVSCSLCPPLHLLWEPAFPKWELRVDMGADTSRVVESHWPGNGVPLYHFFYGHQLTPKDCVEPWFLKHLANMLL